MVGRLVALLLVGSARAAFLPAGPATRPQHHIGAATRPQHRVGAISLSETAPLIQPPDEAARDLLRSEGPSPVLQPREVITTMMNALHESSWDNPRPYFGFEVALRFLSPRHQCYGVVPREFYRYLRQPHKKGLVGWGEYRWEGDLTIFDGNEAYQQISVRSGPESEWSSVRWMLVRASPDERPHSQWMVDAVFVAEPDELAAQPADEWAREKVRPLAEKEVRQLFDGFDVDGSGTVDMSELREAVGRLGVARSEDELRAVISEVDADGSGDLDYGEFERLLEMVNERCALGQLASDLTTANSKRTEVDRSPARVVQTVMDALRKPDEPYPLHGAEVAIRYCSPTNRASQLSPQSFATYLREPWYKILTEWDEMELDDEEEEGVDEDWWSGIASQDVLVKRKGDDDWTVVNWQLSRHNGRWLTDALTIN